MKKIVLLYFGALLVILLNIIVFIAFARVDETKDRQDSSSQVALNFKRTCQETSEKDFCYGRLFATFAQNHQVKESLAVLTQIQRIDKAQIMCHFLAHKIAQAEVNKNPNKWLDVISEFDPAACNRGFFHGAIEGLISSRPDFRLSPATITTICSGMQERLRNANSDSLCAHAVGHMLLVQEKGVIAPSVAICSAVRQQYQFSCSEGVFMEYTDSKNLSLHGIAKKPQWNMSLLAQMSDRCSRYTGNIASGCWVALSSLIAVLTEGDKNRILSYCTAAGKDRDLCYEHAAGLSIYLSLEKQPRVDGMFLYCDAFSPDKDTYPACLSFLSRYVYFSNPDYEAAIRGACQRINKEWRDVCLAKLELVKQEYLSERKNI